MPRVLHAAGTGPTPWCGKRSFSQSWIFSTLMIKSSVFYCFNKTKNTDRDHQFNKHRCRTCNALTLWQSPVPDRNNSPLSLTLLNCVSCGVQWHGPREELYALIQKNGCTASVKRGTQTKGNIPLKPHPRFGHPRLPDWLTKMIDCLLWSGLIRL